MTRGRAIACCSQLPADWDPMNAMWQGSLELLPLARRSSEALRLDGKSLHANLELAMHQPKPLSAFNSLAPFLSGLYLLA